MRPSNVGRPVGRAVTLLAAVAATTLAVAAATGALASTHAIGRSHGERWGLAILSRRDRHVAHSAAANGEAAPPGAILGAVVSNTSLYAWQRAAGETCLVNLHQGGTGGAVCGDTARVEEEGMTAIHQEGEGAAERVRVVGLLPNGVRDVTSVDGDGTTATVPVQNNVFAVEGSEIDSVSYTLPNGAAHEIEVPPVTGRAGRDDQASTSSRAAG